MARQFDFTWVSASGTGAYSLARPQITSSSRLSRDRRRGPLFTDEKKEREHRDDSILEKLFI